MMVLGNWLKVLFAVGSVVRLDVHAAFENFDELAVAAPKRNLAQGSCVAGSNVLGCGPHGSCVQLASNVATCLCEPGHIYTASASPADDCCNAEYDACEKDGQSSFCFFNRGDCKSQPTAPFYSCDCSDPYSGVNCQNTDNKCEDTPSPCIHGTCTFYPYAQDGDPRFICTCERGYSGEACNVQLIIGVGGAGTQLSSSMTVVMWTFFSFAGVVWMYCACSLGCHFFNEYVGKYVKKKAGVK